MELKPIKKIKTSCPFPMLEYKVDVLYNEVRKASGIAYILLELIQKSAMGNEKIAEVALRNADEIKSDTLATELLCGETLENAKEWNINGETVTVSVEKV